MHLVEHEQRPGSIAQLAQAAQDSLREAQQRQRERTQSCMKRKKKKVTWKIQKTNKKNLGKRSVEDSPAFMFLHKKNY